MVRSDRIKEEKSCAIEDVRKINQQSPTFQNAVLSHGGGIHCIPMGPTPQLYCVLVKKE